MIEDYSFEIWSKYVALAVFGSIVSQLRCVFFESFANLFKNAEG